MRKSLNFLMAMILGGVIAASVLYAANVYAQRDAAERGEESQPSVVDGTLRIDNVFQYQGQLLDSSSTPVNGTVTLTFRIYDDPASSSALWFQESTVQVSNGWFTQALGDQPGRGIPDDYLDGRYLWLGVQVGSDAEMTPRQPIRPSMFAVNSRLFDGKSSDYFLEARRGPIAYGVVKADGGRQSGWHFTGASVNASEGRYDIPLEIDGQSLYYDAANFTTVVTPMAGNDVCNGATTFAMTNSFNGRLVVFIRDNNGNPRTCPFHFMTIQHQ